MQFLIVDTALTHSDYICSVLTLVIHNLLCLH